MPAQPTPLREGFVAIPAAEAPRQPGPNDATPQPPLPSQMKLEQPPPEPPLDEYDAARKDIAANAETWPITVQLLYKPIQNDKGELVHSLTFRQPRAVEINRIGNPLRILWDNEVIYEERKMTYIIAALSGIMPPSIEQMDPRDWASCALRLKKFFFPDLRGW